MRIRNSLEKLRGARHDVSMPGGLATTVSEHQDFVDFFHLRRHGSGIATETYERRLKAASPQEVRAAAAVAIQQPVGWNTRADLIVRAGARRAVPWTREDASWLLAVVAGSSLWRRGNVGSDIECTLRLPIAVGRRFAPLTEDAELIDALVESVRQRDDFYDRALRSTLMRRLTELLPPAQTHSLPAALLLDADAFAPAARAALAGHEAAAAARVAQHLDSFGTAVRPGTGWRQEAAALTASLPSAPAVAATLVGLIPDLPESTFSEYGEDYPQLLTSDSLRLVRGAMWLLAGSRDAAAIRLLTSAALRGGIGIGGSGGSSLCQGLATSAVAALGSMAHAEPTAVVTALGQIRDKVPNKTIRKGIDAALEDAATNAGVSRGELLERSVPALGLDPDGRAELPIGDRVALLRLTGEASPKVELRWRDAAGKVTISVPASVKESHAGDLAALRKQAAEIRKLAALQRRRMEDLLALGRSWTAGDWAEHYVGHPVVGWTARGLIWSASRDGQPEHAGLPKQDDQGGWRLRSADGTERPVASDARLRLWHPLDADPEDVAAWRVHLIDTSTRQPFKQAFREVYRLAPAEEQTDTYSNRFAGHVLRYPQAGALMRARDWSAKHLGPWDGGLEGDAVRTFTDTPWRAHFYYDLIEEEALDLGAATLCSSDQVRFESLEGEGRRATWTTRRLRDVPPLVLSEVMRDVDLFVGVTSIAADPTWSDTGTERTRDYWERASFAALGASAEIRREALERLIPRTKLAGRARIDGRFLVVDGSLRTYKIHLGSGNILMSPNDSYLCIVADRQSTTKVFLPFEEGDGMLSMILSKAFLLADDAKITDSTIRRQLRRK